MEVINLNLIPTGALPVVHASQYDEGRTFRANLMDGSTVYTLDGTETLECDVKKPDGNVVTLSVPNTSDSYVDVTTTLQTCACAGDNLADIKITKGAVIIATLNFILAVERSPLEGGIESESEINNLATQVAGLVASEVEDQYDSANVIFDDTPTENHGIGYTVTSEGIGNAIDNALDMTDTASGAIATFESEYALPLRNLEIEINAVQSGSGTPSPDNVRPITGFTGANIHVADDENPHIVDNVTAISWQSEAGTVYGGSLDVTSGVLTVTHGILDLGSESNSWAFSDGGQGRWVCNGLNTIIKIPSTQAIVANIICSHYQSKTARNIYGGRVGIAINTDGNIWIHDPTYDGYTPTDFKTAINGVMLVYELATPATYQLTPTQISAIVGTNNVFTDTNGDTSLEYYTKSGEQTVRIAEGVAVDVINNKNIDNLTTTNKTLVGAVNEVNGKTKPTTVTPTFNSSQSNYSIPFNNTRVYKIGNIVYFNSSIQADAPYGSSPGQVVYSGLPKPYSNDNLYMGFCAWNVTSSNMRVIVTTDGKLQCRGGNNGTAYDISFSYVCQ